MKNCITFSCKIGTTDASASLGLEIWLDDLPIYNNKHVDREQELTYEFNDSDGVHELRFVMKNKTVDHTQIDESGQILKDACLTITDVTFDDIALGHTFIEKTTYTHDFNGTKQEITENFYGSMGCNGTVTLKFTTPIYLWLLENM